MASPAICIDWHGDPLFHYRTWATPQRTIYSLFHFSPTALVLDLLKDRQTMMEREAFRKVAHRVAEVVGTPQAFAIALAAIVLWLVTGPFFHFSDTWQLVINTATTIITFLMVFLIQNSQNRDAKAFHIKLDELIRGVRGARTEMVDLEELTDEELEKMHDEFRKLHEKLAKKILHRKTRLR